MNHFNEYQNLNQHLLRLIMSGQSDSKDAEDVRDLMDFHWYKMSVEEQQLARQINEGRNS